EVPTYWNCIADFEGKQTRAQLLKGYSDLVERYIVFHSGDTKLELPKVSIPRVHFAFFDAVHTYEYVMFEFEAIRHKQLAGDIIVFDDYNKVAFPGVVQAVDEIAAKHGYTKRVITPPSNRSYVVARKS
ncbi:MAG TPA: class I SAM-dependent methyltransferase, partial [Thermoanaerobaculia bacterium]|nr:class I SAM-dependent methyltransferase [Thermoanaerobaculia bacterium]